MDFKCYRITRFSFINSFYRNEQAYAEAIKNAKAAVELEDYDLAYQSISEKKPKTADELLFKKIKLIKFSKLNLASDYDLSPPLGVSLISNG